MTVAKGSRWRHRKRGSSYLAEAVETSGCVLQEGESCTVSGRVLVRAEPGPGTYSVQSGGPVPAGTTFVLYKGSDKVGWARPVSEFVDGRFERIC